MSITRANFLHLLTSYFRHKTNCCYHKKGAPQSGDDWWWWQGILMIAYSTVVSHSNNFGKDKSKWSITCMFHRESIESMITSEIKSKWWIYTNNIGQEMSFNKLFQEKMEWLQYGIDRSCMQFSPAYGNIYSVWTWRT
jgi:hypothetical protein